MPDRQGLRKAHRYFSLEQLTDGVYAAIGLLNACGMSNAGIIDLGGRTVVFDTFASPQAGEELRRAAIAVTGRIPDWVIISHAHSDH